MREALQSSVVAVLRTYKASNRPDLYLDAVKQLLSSHVPGTLNLQYSIKENSKV